jgi:hypothetical protein
VPPSIASIAMGTHMWIHWLEIGAERERAACEARTRSVGLGIEAAEFIDKISAELHASMVAISAAAHAIDALYGEIKPLVPVPAARLSAWEQNRAPRYSRILETLKIGCKLGAKTNRWPAEFKALYQLRDPVVHHELKLLPPVPHPNRLTSVAQEVADYCVGNVAKSLDFAFDVASSVIRAPRIPALVTWANTMAHVPAHLDAVRSPGASGSGELARCNPTLRPSG